MKGNLPSTVMNSSLEGPDQDLMSDARIILAVRVQVRQLLGGSREGGTNPLACAPISTAAAAHETGANAMRDGTIMPQPGLTQMASAAGLGDGDWSFLCPRLTGMAKASGDPGFVVPPAACSTKTILPRFALGFRLLKSCSRG